MVRTLMSFEHGADGDYRLRLSVIKVKIIASWHTLIVDQTALESRVLVKAKRKHQSFENKLTLVQRSAEAQIDKGKRTWHL